MSFIFYLPTLYLPYNKGCWVHAVYMYPTLVVPDVQVILTLMELKIRKHLIGIKFKQQSMSLIPIYRKYTAYASSLCVCADTVQLYTVHKFQTYERYRRGYLV